jgi:hypothetical protein
MNTGGNLAVADLATDATQLFLQVLNLKSFHEKLAQTEKTYVSDRTR